MKRSAIPPFEGLGDKQLRGVGSRLDRLADPNGYKHADLLRKHASDAAGLAWHLARHGLAGVTWTSAGLLHVLAEGCERADAGDAIAVLRRLPDDTGALDRGRAREWTMLTPGMLLDVDRLVLRAYVADRAALLAIRDEVGPNLRLAIDCVRRRAGEAIAEDEAREILGHLARQHAAYGLALNIDVPRVVDGALVETRLRDAAAVRALAGLFGDGAAWAEAQRAWLLARVRGFRGEVDGMTERVIDALRTASLAEVVYLFGDGYWSAGTLLRALDAREDAAEALFAAAEGLAREGLAPFKVAAEQVPEERAARGGYDEDEGAEEDAGGDEYGGDYEDEYDGGGEDEDEDDAVEAVEPGPDDDRVRGLAEALTLVGIERTAGEVPTEVDGRFELARVFDSEPGYVGRLRGVLARLGPARAHAVVRRVLAQQFYFGRAAAIVDVCFEAGLVDEVFARIEAGDYGIDAGLLGLCGLAVVPAAAARMATSEAKHAAGYGEAILYVLARAAAAGQTWDPSWDEHVHLEHVRFAYGGSKVEPILAMLAGLAAERHARVLQVNLERCGEEPWRVVRCLRGDDPPALIEAAFAGLFARRSTITPGSLGEGLRKIGVAIVGPLRRAFATTPTESTLMRELERALDPAAFAAFKAGLGRPIETKEQELRRLAAALPGPKVRVYRLARGDAAPAADAVARIGGQPRGVAEAPRRGSEAMRHVLTLDLAALPELARRYPGMRSLSLYLPDPDDAELHEAGELVWTREEDLGRAPGSTAEARALVALAFDVPAAIFAEEVEGEAKQVRRLLYSSSGHALGGPLWLQDGLAGVDPEFVCQFDESLCSINLGDMGVMYVFAGSITWQCH